MAGVPSDTHDLFKKEFKRYKKSSGSDFIDVRTPEHFRNEVRLSSLNTHDIKNATVCTYLSELPLQLTEFAAIIGESTGSKFGLKSPQEWKLYRHNSIPGLIVIPNPFLPEGQLHWVARCLIDYPCKPNICNLDAHMEREGDGSLWPVNSMLCSGEGG